MQASSQAALTAAAERFEPVLREAGERAQTFGSELYQFADTLAGAGSLRRALTDPARDGEAKARLVSELIGQRASAEVVDLLAGMVRSRWSAEADLEEAVAELGTTAVLASAQAQDTLLQVEDELFRIERLLASNRELQAALTDPDASVERRLALLHELLASRTLPQTEQVVERLTAVGRAGTLRAGLRRVGELAAARRSQRVATVTAAAPLSQAQEQRLAQILSRSYGAEVHVNVALEPAVIGGLRVQIGDEVIDATMLSRLQDARRRFAG